MNQTPDPKPGSQSNDWSRIAGLAATGVYLVLAAVTLAWGAYNRLHIAQAPIVDPDIRGYLGPAMYALAGKYFVHLDGRSFPYPTFVFVVLRLFGDFRAISVIQHLLGVAAGALVMLAWNAVVRLVPKGGIPAEVSRFIGLVPAAIYCGSATAIHLEQQIRPEGIFSFLTILDILLGFLFLESCFLRRKPSAVWLGTLNVFVAYLIYLLKPSFGLAAVFATAPVLAGLILPGLELRRRGMLLAVAVLPAVLLLFLPEHILKRNDVWGTEFLPETLFSVHASIILDQLSSDLATNAQGPYSRDVIQSAHDLLAIDLKAAAANTGTKAYPSLGYNPDYLMYDSFCVEFAKVTNWTPEALNKFYYYYYRRASHDQAPAMFHKVTTQMELFYNAKLPVYRLGQSLDVTDDYARAPDLISRKITVNAGYPPLAAYFQQCANLAKSGAAITQEKRFTEWTRLLSAHYLDLLAIAIVSPVLLIARPLRRHLVWVVVALWIVYGYNFGNCLTIAIVHSLEVARYVRAQLIYTVFAQCLTVYLILEAPTFGVRSLLARRAKPSESLS